MRLSFALVLVFLLPSASFAQTEEMIKDIEKKLATLKTAKWILTQAAPDGGFYLAPQDPKADAKPVRLIIILLAAMHAAVALCFKVLFFSYYIVKGEKDPISIVG